MFTYEEVKDFILEEIKEKGYCKAEINPSGELKGYIDQMVNEGLIRLIDGKDTNPSQPGLIFMKLVRK